MNATSDKFIFRGTPQEEMFYNPDQNFGIYLFYTEEEVNSSAVKKQSFGKKRYGTILGNMQRLNLGTQYTMEVEEKYNARYKKIQFNALKVYEEIPKTLEQKRIFLETILTVKQTNTLLEHNENIIEDIMSGKEIDVSELHNIKENRIEVVKRRVLESYVLADLLIFLTPYGINFSQVKKISSMSSNPSLVKEMISDNPYILCKVDGLSFANVDKIALKIDSNLRKSNKRIFAFIEDLLELKGESDGHTWLLKEDIINFAMRTMPECREELRAILNSDVEYDFLHIEGDKIGRKKDYEVELAIYNELERINNAEKTAFTRPTIEKIAEFVKVIEEEQGYVLSDEQRKTVDSLAEDNNVVIVSGLSGSGKSSAVNAISNTMEMAQENKRLSISQMALSAKASIRLKQVTKRYSTTIHKFLYDVNMEFQPQENIREETLGFSEKIQSAEIEEEEKERMESLANIRKSDIVIIDEFSMVNIYLTLKVLKEVKTGAMIIFVFDYAQLPAIGAGAVAYDLLELSEYNKSKYVEVHRQGQSSGILMDANTIRQQINPLQGFEKSITTGESKDMTYMFRIKREQINNLAIKSFIGGAKKFGIDNINIICPRKDTVLNSAYELNYKIQDILLPKGAVGEFTNPITKKDFRLGDKVIHKKNMATLGVFNGEIGTVIAINANDKFPVVVRYSYEDEDESKTIKYDVQLMKHLQLAYALTVHSYQGSENKAIIVVMDSDSNMLLDNTMLYTAMTRAKDRCVLITDPKSFLRCITEHKTLIRNTWLKGILIEGGGW